MCRRWSGPTTASRKDGAVGVDGVTKEQYGRKLQENLENLHKRLKAKQYRHQPIRRVHIPKDNGKTRPIGISAFEDRVVQDAIREVLQAIYEQDFLECSHGFRPGRSAHDAIRALDRVVHRGEVNWVLEADIVSFFDSLDRTELKKLIQIRVADGSLLRLIGKCLHVGVLDGADYTEPEQGTIQGSGLSPLLGNIYLHYVLDLWFEREVKAAPARQSNADQVCGRSADYVRESGRCEARDGSTRQADGTLRTDPTSGQDPPIALPATAVGAVERERSGHLRLSWFHDVLRASQDRKVGDVVQDP